MSPKKLKVLRLLMDHSQGLYGSELVSRSNGYLSRGTIYTLLDRLIEEGLVREVVEEPTPAFQMSRTRHLITADGTRAVQAYAAEMGLEVKSS